MRIADLERLSPNLEVLAEYKQKYEDYMQKAADLAAITSSREEAKEAYDNLCKKRLDSFMIGFTTISQKLKEMYQVCWCFQYVYAPDDYAGRKRRVGTR